jgi:hypothetical protein
MGINPMNKITIIIRILFAVTLFQHFQLHPISDYVEDLAMNLFSTTLHDNAQRWYNNLPNASISSMDKLEEVFLQRWSVKRNPNILLMRLNCLTKVENETVQEFHDKFERIVQQIPVSHHPSSSFLTFLYTKAFSGQSKIFLDIMSQGQSKNLLT